ncbi:Alpha-D-kanosaminyltransferase [Caulifigura coniformis]|uniref:Alpha-D-kanosaminyltransferase n=1 Tax=Caulifigura coniformis TaxID=2527983 RepID=A0A517SG69_9PLAN|nr:glycosyltransferase [Caulifigura coniformis]QDT55121.1 Alpha-D-kanosaminyltransferase [Caulifigura coniformis]
MRICQVMIGAGFGGAERSFVDTALAMADRGHAVQAVCHRDFVKRDLLEAHANIRVSPVLVRGAWDFAGARRMQNAIGEFGPDVMHVHLARAAHLAGPIGRRMGVPVIAKLHNYANLKYYRQVDAFIGTTEDQRGYLAKNGIDGPRATVIPNFSRMPVIETLRAQPVAKAARPVKFITCGRLHTVKGFDILLKALKQLHLEGQCAQLIVGGSGPEHESLLKLRDELGLHDDVEFAGWIDDTSRFLDRGDIYVLSSRTESFGISLLEAMARGLPIVSTRCQGPSQLLTDSQAWFAAPENVGSLAAAMRASIDQSEERTRRAGDLRDLFATTYAESHVAPRILQFYKDCGARESGDAALDSAWPWQFVEATSLAEAETSTTRMLVNRQMSLRLRSMGWTSCRAVMQASNVDVLRETNGRDNCRVELGAGSPGHGPRFGYLKRHRERTKSRLFRDQFVPAGWNEAEAVGLCERSGVATMRVLATGFEKAGEETGAAVESFSLTEAIRGESGFHTARRWHDEGIFDESEVVALRREMISAAADLVRRMHFAGLAHQDLFWQHLFFEPRTDGRLAARVIDVQRMIRPGSMAAWSYFWIKDMEQLRFSMQRMGFRDDDVKHWYQCYFAQTGLTPWQRLLTGTIRLRGIRRALKMALKQRGRTNSIPSSPAGRTVGQRHAA